MRKVFFLLSIETGSVFCSELLFIISHGNFDSYYLILNSVVDVGIMYHLDKHIGQIMGEEEETEEGKSIIRLILLSVNG